MRVSSPLYGNGAGAFCFLLLGLFIWGLWDRGFKSVTNLLLLVPILLWGVEGGYSSSISRFGFWPVLLWATTFIAMLGWVLAQVDRDMDGAA